MQNTLNPLYCSCGSAKNYSECCGLYIKQHHKAPTAEALMRSRYTAYALNYPNYLLSSWHPTTRPSDLKTLELHTASWKKLNILYREKGQPQDTVGTITFIASYLDESTTLRYLCEKSHFERIADQWFYLDGEIINLSKNGLCPCSSGKKFKRCCGQ